MSIVRAENGMLITEVPKDYSDGMTKQSFKDSTDINKIIAKSQVSDGLSHAMKYDKAQYGEFTGVDLLGAFQQIERAEKIFSDLPSEVRREFDQDAFKFAAFASDPANINRLETLLPAIAKPGRYFPKPGDEASASIAPVGAPVAAASPDPSPPPGGTGIEAPGGDGAASASSVT